ncbi:MAG: 2-hydroxychromene-2-carboxylate isomerase [Roseiarcus sp.]
MAKVDFWYEFASTYSYPAAMRIEALAATRGVSVAWRPFLLGPLFADQGWRDSPFNIYPVKGRYMWRDMERVCGALGLPLRRPEAFPQNSLLAARVALALEGETRAAFSRAVYRAEFAESRSIADPATLAAALNEVGVEAEGALARAQDGAVKECLKAECAQAKALRLPGAPCLVAEDGEIFWGNDRLEQGLDWAVDAAARHETGGKGGRR